MQLVVGAFKQYLIIIFVSLSVKNLKDETINQSLNVFHSFRYNR